jgi:hypothetical protein
LPCVFEKINNGIHPSLRSVILLYKYLQMNLNRSKLFLYGGCDLHDIAKNDLLQKDFDVIDYAIDKSNVDNSSLDFNQRSFPQIGTSVISLYSKPGPIAQRVLETLSTSQHRDIINNIAVYNEILKFPYLDFYKKHAGSKDYLLLGFSPELYTKYLKGQECFTCPPSMSVLEEKNNPLHWIVEECFRKDEYLLSFDSRDSINWTSELLVDFARDVYEIFQNRVILVKTHLSYFVISKDHKIKKVDANCHTSIPYYKQTKIITDPLDQNYAERLAMLIMQKFKHYYPVDLEEISLNEPVFVDANHRWGHSQFHLDSSSRMKITKLIYQTLTKKEVYE